MQAETPDTTRVLRRLAARVFMLALLSEITGETLLAIALTLAACGLLFTRLP